MKPVALFIALGLSLAANAFAQQSKSDFPPAPPPPGMNDPGVNTTLPSPVPAYGSTVATPATPARPAAAGQAGPSPRDANGDAPPTVQVHSEGDNTVQEFRRNGQVYMVVVTSKAGISQTYNVDPKGAWTNNAGEPVKPVMYKVLEWGKGKPADDQGDDGK